MHSFKLITYLIKIVLAEKKHILFLVSNISSVKKNAIWPKKYILVCNIFHTKKINTMNNKNNIEKK